MRKVLIATLIGLLAVQSMAFARQSGDDLGEQPAPEARTSSPAQPATAPVNGVQPPPSYGLSEIIPAQCDVASRSGAFGLSGSDEYLFWWFKNGGIPPLVTTGGDGKVGSPGTRVLLDNFNFDDAVRHGGRFALRYQFESIPRIRVEANYFFVAGRQNDTCFSSDGNPLLAQPFIDAVSGLPDATVVAEQGMAAGTITIGSRTSLWGTEANLSTSLIRSDWLCVATVGGFRFLQLEDEIASREQFQVSPSVPGFGGSKVALQDDFRTMNNFFGGQVGLDCGVQFGALAIDFRGKLALGQMQQTADVNGATNSLSPNGSTTVFQGGLYALRSNIGRHDREELAFIPEVGVNLGFQVLRCLKLYAGYSFLWVSTVARAGEQIDPVVNQSQFPVRSGNGPLVGPARPAFDFHTSDFWAQGLSFGVEMRY